MCRQCLIHMTHSQTKGQRSPPDSSYLSRWCGMDGGRRDVFKLSRDRLSVQEVVDAVGSASCGAVSLFIGTTRQDDVDGRKVVGLEYEAANVRARWPTSSTCVWVEVGEASVVIAISSPHRRDGQEAIQFYVTQLKAAVPIWKKVPVLHYP
uniref:Uncharacterized protein n=1 Tax=Sphaeramia orbicularis TaxID=375764 RepID=A0A673AWK0_9TELE